MQIKLSLKVFIFVLFFCLSGEIDIYLAIMIFALLHEMGHMLIGITLGFKIQTLNIMPIGFAVSFKVDTKNYNKKILKANLLTLKKIIIAIAGPLVNLLFIIIFIMLGKEKVLGIDFEILVYSNLLILIFNLMPIYPLDGGRILKNTFYLFYGKLNSLILTMYISNIVAIVLTIITIGISIVSKNLMYLLVLVYIWIIVERENKISKMKIKMYKILKNNIAIN